MVTFAAGLSQILFGKVLLALPEELKRRIIGNG
jgi:hypothetical protein